MAGKIIIGGGETSPSTLLKVFGVIFCIIVIFAILGLTGVI